MGFPDSFQIVGERGQGSTEGDRQQAAFYKQIGNAVCPPVIRAIATEMLRVLGARGGGR